MTGAPRARRKFMASEVIIAMPGIPRQYAGRSQLRSLEADRAGALAYRYLSQFLDHML